MIPLSVVNSGEHWNSMMALDALLTKFAAHAPASKAWG